MCNVNCILFGLKFLKDEIRGKKIIEVGSYNENGGLREFLDFWNPDEYIGIDITQGPGVDIVCSAEKILENFEKESFDIVISTEVLEHIKDWRKAISNIKAVCKPNGIILISTRSYGFGYHGFPYDFWRYELEDMNKIFSDCEILSIQKDLSAGSPGVFIKVRKPINLVENDLSEHKLYSILIDKRLKNIKDSDVDNFLFHYKYMNKITHWLNKLNRFMNKLIKLL